LDQNAENGGTAMNEFFRKYFQPRLPHPALALLIVAWTLIAPTAHAENDNGLSEPISSTAPATSPATAPSHKTEAEIRTQYQLLQIAKKSLEIRKLQEKLAGEPKKSKEIEDKIAAGQKELDSLNKSFESLATQLQDEELHEAKGSPINWLQAIEDITQPLLKAVREVTEKPRKIDELRAKITALEAKKRRYEQAKNNILELATIARDATLPLEGDPSKLKDAVTARELLQVYKTQILSLKAKYDPEIVRLNLEEARRQLHELQSSEQSAFGVISQAMGGFFATRGWNMALAMMIFVGLWWALTFFINWVQEKSRSLVEIKSPLRKALKAVSNLTAFLFAAFAGLISLYLLDDWLMFCLVILFLAGIAWTFRSLLPQFLKELRLILNLGNVREGERIVWKGIPWKIRELGVFAVLSNPLLGGGKIKVPVGQLAEECSRPVVENEPWFPTQTGEYVLLSDGTYGRVLTQTMEQVILKHQNSTKYYAAADFLALKPLNISTGFMHAFPFSLDYAVQQRICNEIPQLFQNGLKRLLKDYIECNPQKLTSILVQFDNAGISSLNLIVVAEFDGHCADEYFFYRREIHRALVEICNENNLKIPFQQITLNLAEGMKAPGILPQTPNT
jgi:hypothetical protein